MRIQSNGLVFDREDADCKLILSKCQDDVFAFVQCIDTGMDGSQREIKRYWGRYCFEQSEESILQILRWGGQWPDL